MTLRQIIAVVCAARRHHQDTVRVHVGSLRRKLEPDPSDPRYIGTEPWVGYRFLASRSTAKTLESFRSSSVLLPPPPPLGHERRDIHSHRGLGLRTSSSSIRRLLAI